MAAVAVEEACPSEHVERGSDRFPWGDHQVLVLGGTQFMGRWVVQHLLEHGQRVTMINRGKTPNPFEGHPNLTHWACDRMRERKKFRGLLKKPPSGSWGLIVDFIGFHQQFIQDVVSALYVEGSELEGEGGRPAFNVRHYIYISTDSVYWALKLPDVYEPGQGLTEDSCVEFTDEEYQAHKKTHLLLTETGRYQMGYGGNKLSCDRYLQEAWSKWRFPYTSLRLPDVYGPHDNLGGFWEFAQRVLAGQAVPAYIPPARMRPQAGKNRSDFRAHRFSWAYARDVRDAIFAAARAGEVALGEVFHVAHEEATSITELAALVAEEAGVTPAPLVDRARESDLPTTDFGALSVAKALRVLGPWGWQPTPLREAVREALAWWRESEGNRRHHREMQRYM